MKLPPDSAERIAAAVAEAERHTSVEIVFVARPSSGAYRDADLLVGGAAALAFLAFALFSRVVVPALGVPGGMLLCACAGTILSRSLPSLRRLLTSRARRQRQAREAALVTFLQRGVDRTQGRTGVLVHISFLERAVTFVPDHGIQAEVAPSDLEPLRAAFVRAVVAPDSRAVVDGLCTAIVALGRALGERLPPSAENPNELDDTPLLEEGL